ncbi:MAG: hypothetical protein QF864_15495 [SAR202 cluster bacterium]|jgi:hypothetical protein|nr:hypothetical protein [SAR202 cluster bacterium]|tara:strand:- start:163 stop:471 length:309 start_codon:yes stop_codon:yes gene_type:complete
MIKMTILFALLGTNPAIKANTMIAHIETPYSSHTECWKDKERNIVGVIKEVFEKTGQEFDWMNALCISETDMSMTFEFSESLREYWKRQRDETKRKSINYVK